jgi:hypothetical protein
MKDPLVRHATPNGLNFLFPAFDANAPTRQRANAPTRQRANARQTSALARRGGWSSSALKVRPAKLPPLDMAQPPLQSLQQDGHAQGIRTCRAWSRPKFPTGSVPRTASTRLWQPALHSKDMPPGRVGICTAKSSFLILFQMTTSSPPSARAMRPPSVDMAA